MRQQWLDYILINSIKRFLSIENQIINTPVLYLNDSTNLDSLHIITAFKMSAIKFNNSNSPFFKSLRNKVDNYFLTNKVEKTGNKVLYFKAIFLSLLAIGIYVTLLFFTPGILFSILLCSLLGINMALIGFNVMHDGGHSSFSRYEWVNKFCAYSLNVDLQQKTGHYFKLLIDF